MNTNRLLNTVGPALSMLGGSQLRIPGGLSFAIEPGAKGGKGAKEAEGGKGGKGKEAESESEEEAESESEEEAESESEEDGEEDGEGKAEDLAALRAENARLSKRVKGLSGESAKRKERLRKLEENAKDQLTPEELIEWKKEKKARVDAEEKKKQDKGEYGGLLKEKQAKFDADLAAEKQKTVELKSKLDGERVSNKLVGLVRQFTTAEPSDVIAACFAGKVIIDAETDDFAIKVLLKGGELGWPVDEEGEEIPLDKFVEQEITKRPYFAAYKPQGGSGGKSQAGKGGKGDLTPEDIANMPMSDFIKNRDKLIAQADANTNKKAG